MSPEVVLVVAFVDGETPQVARIPPGDLRPKYGFMPPFGRGLDVKDGLGV